MKVQKYIWIDDNPERQGAANNMKDSLKVNIDFIDVKDKAFQEIIHNVLLGDEPDLIIIDHNLEDIGSGIFKKGSSVAPYIRESWPECPIICVSAVDINEVDSQQKLLYEEIFSISDISENYTEIKSIADSYQIIRANRPHNINELMDLLKVPEADKIKVASIFPTVLRDDFTDRSLTVKIAKWVRKSLINRPGFLYDKIWFSTLIGIKVESLSRVESKFSNSLYEGIFAQENQPRWWKSNLLSTLYELSETPGLPWEKGRGLENITPEDYSKCYASDAFYPETVAYTDQTRDAYQVSIKIKESIPHPDFGNLLHFEQIRLMKAAE